MRTLVIIVLNNGKQYVDAGLRVKRLKEPSSSAELVLVLLMTETSYMCTLKVTVQKTVFDNISSRDLTIFHFCKKQMNRLAEPVNVFFTEIQNI